MNYVPIRLSTLQPNIRLEFDLYLHLNGKYLHYIRRGDDIEPPRLTSLKDRQVRRLFILAEDEDAYQNFLDYFLDEAIKNPNMSTEDRAKRVGGVAQASVEDFHEDPTSVQTYRQLEKAAFGIVSVIGKRTDILKHFFETMKESDADVIFKHAITVSSLATYLAEDLQLDEKTIKDISIASMLLDVGVVNMPPGSRSLFIMPFEKFATKDWKLYRTHPKLAYDLLGDRAQHINADILSYILNHEERKSGEGFPSKKTQLSLPNEIIGLCSCYDRMVTCLGKSHNDALKELQISQVGNFDLSLIQKLKNILKSQGLSV